MRIILYPSSKLEVYLNKTVELKDLKDLNHPNFVPAPSYFPAKGREPQSPALRSGELSV